MSVALSAEARSIRVSVLSGGLWNVANATTAESWKTLAASKRPAFTSAESQRTMHSALAQATALQAMQRQRANVIAQLPQLRTCCELRLATAAQRGNNHGAHVQRRHGSWQ